MCRLLVLLSFVLDTEEITSTVIVSSSRPYVASHDLNPMQNLRLELEPCVLDLGLAQTVSIPMFTQGRCSQPGTPTGMAFGSCAGPGWLKGAQLPFVHVWSVWKLTYIHVLTIVSISKGKS